MGQARNGTLGPQMEWARNGTGTKWPGTKWPGTKWPARNGWARNGRARSGIDPILASLVDNSVRPPSQILGEDAPA